MKLFKKPKSKFYWYDFTVRGRRLAGFLLLARRPVISPIERPTPSMFSSESLARGEVLAAEGHCAACHTQPGGQPFASGYALHTPFGIIYGDNISPDPQPA